MKHLFLILLVIFQIVFNILYLIHPRYAVDSTLVVAGPLSWIVSNIASVAAVVISWVTFRFFLAPLDYFVRSPARLFYMQVMNSLTFGFFTLMIVAGWLGNPVSPQPSGEPAPATADSAHPDDATADSGSDSPASDSEDTPGLTYRGAASQDDDPPIDSTPARIPEPSASPKPSSGREPAETTAGKKDFWKPPGYSHRPDEAQPRSEPPSQPAPKREARSETGPGRDPAKLRLAELKGDLAELEAEMDQERARYKASLATINRLTNNKRTPVREGSPAYHKCLAASKVIREIERKAPGMKAKKAKLEAAVKELEK